MSFFLTQYALQPIDEAAGFIAAPRQLLLQGLHAPHPAPQAEARYVFALDVGGGAEQQDPSAHDWTALTIAEVLPTEDLPAYQIVARRAWQGANQPTLFDALIRLVTDWNPTALAVDATGLGAGLAERLNAALPGRVRPYVFSRATKSALGWQLLAAIDSLRLRDHLRTGTDGLQEAFWLQAQTATAIYGANRTIAWGLPDPAHDDLLISAALLTTLDDFAHGSAEFHIVKPRSRPL